VYKDLRIERGKNFGGLKEIEYASLAFGSFGELGEAAEDLIARSDEPVDGVEGAVLVCGIEDVVDDEECLSVLARSVGEAALEFEVRVDGVGLERDGVCQGSPPLSFELRRCLEFSVVTKFNGSRNRFCYPEEKIFLLVCDLARSSVENAEGTDDSAVMRLQLGSSVEANASLKEEGIIGRARILGSVGDYEYVFGEDHLSAGAS
jgi:hypothetical protein